MNSIFSTMYDPTKDRRYGMLFLVTVAVFFCLYALGMFAFGALDGSDIGNSYLETLFLRALPGILIFIAALVWRGIRRNRTRKKEKFQRQELSRDEMRKARSKLVKAKS